MKAFIHNSRYDYSNSYLIGPDGPGDAIVIDPVDLDVALLELIENNRYYVRAVLFTTPRRQTAQGLRTLMRVYDAEIYSSYPRVFQFPGRVIEHGQTLQFPGVTVEAIALEQYSRYSLLFRIGGLLFTGALVSAGLVGERHTDVERHLIAAALREATAALPDETIILPAFGPPSTLGAERRFNLDLAAFSPCEPP